MTSRLKIYNYLEKNGFKNESEITDFIKLRQPTVSYHLDMLVKTGVFVKQKQDKNFVYGINPMCPTDSSNCLIKSNA